MQIEWSVGEGSPGRGAPDDAREWISWTDDDVFGLIIVADGGLRWCTEAVEDVVPWIDMTPSDLPLEDLKKQVETVMRMGVTTCK